MSDIMDEFHAAVADNELTRLRARVAELEGRVSEESSICIGDLKRLADQMERHDYPDDAETCRNAVTRIAALEGQVKALSAEPTMDETITIAHALCIPATPWVTEALNTFLRRRSEP